MLAIYLSTLPLGVALTGFFQKDISHMAVMIITGLAIGSLVGCLIFDFILPSINFVKRSALQATWLVAGLFLALLLN